MEKNRLEILKKLADGIITIEEADAKITLLFYDEVKILSENVEDGKSHWLHKYEDASDESQHEMEGYQWALNDIIEKWK